MTTRIDMTAPYKPDRKQIIHSIRKAIKTLLPCYNFMIMTEYGQSVLCEKRPQIDSIEGKEQWVPRGNWDYAGRLFDDYYPRDKFKDSLIDLRDKEEIPIVLGEFDLIEFLSAQRASLIELALDQTNQNQSKAAQALGVSPQAVHKYVTKRTRGF